MEGYSQDGTWAPNFFNVAKIILGCSTLSQHQFQNVASLGHSNFFMFSNQFDHGSKFICVNQELKDIDKQIFTNKKNVGIVITNVVEVAPTKKKRRVKPHFCFWALN